MGHGEPDVNHIKTQEVTLTQRLDHYDKILSGSTYLVGKVSRLELEVILSAVPSAVVTDMLLGVQFDRPLPYTLVKHALHIGVGG